MKSRIAAAMRVLAMASLIALLADEYAFARERVGPDADREAIEANIAAYTKAYLAKDAGALAEFWSDSGECIRPLSGQLIRGRRNIEKEYTDMFAGSGDLALEVDLEPIRIPHDNELAAFSPVNATSRTAVELAPVK